FVSSGPRPYHMAINRPEPPRSLIVSSGRAPPITLGLRGPSLTNPRPLTDRSCFGIYSSTKVCSCFCLAPLVAALRVAPAAGQGRCSVPEGWPQATLDGRGGRPMLSAGGKTNPSSV